MLIFVTLVLIHAVAWELKYAALDLWDRARERWEDR